MIQFNLLPDVKIEYIKASQTKRVVTIVSVITAAVALSIFVLLVLSVEVVQKAHINNLNSQIGGMTTKLKNISNLNEVLTIQNEVNALPSLNAQKPVVTRLPGYIAELTPQLATISDLTANYLKNTITITGAADGLATINQFVDTLKLSSYQTSPTASPKNAFSSVLLSSFGYNSTSGASYTITATFDPAIFSSNNTSVTLSVPNVNTSHSSGSSSALFQSQSSNSRTGQ